MKRIIVLFVLFLVLSVSAFAEKDKVEQARYDGMKMGVVVGAVISKLGLDFLFELTPEEMTDVIYEKSMKFVLKKANEGNSNVSTDEAKTLLKDIIKDMTIKYTKEKGE